MKNIDTAVILASGAGTRLQPETLTTPKPLLTLCGHFLIEYVLENLFLAGVQKVIITTRYFPEQFPEKLGAKYKGIELAYKVLPEEKRLGTAGDLKAAEDLLPANAPFFVCNSDVITDFDFNLLAGSYFESGGLPTIALVDNSGEDVGLDKDGKISKILKSSFGDTVKSYTFACQHIIKKETLDLIPKGTAWGFFGEGDVYPELISCGEKLNAFIYPTGTYWQDVGTWDNFHKVEEDLKRKSPISLLLK